MIDWGESQVLDGNQEVMVCFKGGARGCFVCMLDMQSCNSGVLIGVQNQGGGDIRLLYERWLITNFISCQLFCCGGDKFTSS